MDLVILSLMVKLNFTWLLKTRSQAVARIADRTASLTFRENYLRACSAFPIQSHVPNLKSLAQVVLEICSIACQKLSGSHDLGHATFRENYLCARSAFPIQSCTPNLKLLAQAVFEILRSTRIGSRVWPFKVTWRHRSRNHSIAHIPFPIGGSLEPSLYLWRFPRYSTSNVTQWLTWPWNDF